MNVVFGADAPRLRGVTAAEDFALVVVPDNVVVDAGTHEASIADVSYSETWSSYTAYRSDVTSVGETSVQYSSLTPEVCSIDAVTGVVSGVRDPQKTLPSSNVYGTCSIRAAGRTGARVTSFKVGVSQTSTRSGHYNNDPNSLRYYLVNQQLAALTGVTPGSAAQRASVSPNNYYTNTGGDALTVTMSGGTYGGPNLDHFLLANSPAQLAAGFDPLPADALKEILCGVGTSASIEWKAWITPHHYLCWRGHGSVSGATWIALDNTDSTGEVIVQYSATRWEGMLVKLLPENLEDYAPQLDESAGQVGSLLEGWARYYNTYDSPSTPDLTERRWVIPFSKDVTDPYAVGDVRRDYQRWKATGPALINGGDSGSPQFCGINGELVMLGQAGSADLCNHVYLADINAALAVLNASGTYTVQTVDLSGFTLYA